MTMTMDFRQSYRGVNSSYDTSFAYHEDTSFRHTVVGWQGKNFPGGDIRIHNESVDYLVHYHRHANPQALPYTPGANHFDIVDPIYNLHLQFIAPVLPPPLFKTYVNLEYSNERDYYDAVALFEDALAKEFMDPKLWSSKKVTDAVLRDSHGNLGKFHSDEPLVPGDFAEAVDFLQLRIIGSGKGDTFHGGALNDFISGGDRKDTVLGDYGDDILAGDDGPDTLDGNEGDDEVRGGDDNDILSGGSGSDELSGDADNDTLDGGTGPDQIVGGEGNDRIFGGVGNDTLDGGDGDDIVHGEDGAEVIILGGRGDDIVGGDAGSDLVDGGADNDLVLGGPGADVLVGGTGDDRLIGDERTLDFGGFVVDPRKDTLTGGKGEDTFIFEAPLIPVNVDTITDFQPGLDHIALSPRIYPALHGKLDKGEFRLGKFAVDSDDRIIYDGGKGYLYYDADGIGHASPRTLFAILTHHPALTFTDFFGG